MHVKSLISMGVIYIATSPSGKSYVGQTRYDVMNRWRDHMYDALDPKKDHCKLLNKAIRKYGGITFVVKVVEICNDEHLNEREVHYIQHFNTIKPHGYNLSYGGASCHLDETKVKISSSLKGRPKTHESLLKRSATKKNGSDLPMYLIEHKKQGCVIGYRVTYPRFPEKKFANTKLSLAENLQRAREYLDSINSTVAVQRPDGDGSIHIG